MNSSWYLTVILGALALAALAAAVVLQLAGSDATHAWEGFAILVAYFAGVHVPAPAAK